MADIFVRDANLVYLMEKTGYNITQENGQRKFGPPPGWIGPPPPKGSEIFIKKLPRDVYEDELVPLCEQFGKIYELRLMVDFNGENRGYSFVTYTNVDDATNAIKHLDDYEIRPGRHIGVCKSIDNCRLFVGGIPKDKSKEEIMAEISKYTEGASKVILYSSIVDKSKNRGFAFVEYKTHREAAMARNTLLQSNIRLFDKKIAVDFAYLEGDVEDETMKRVYFKFPLPPPPRPPKAVLEYLYQHTLASSVNYRSAPRVFMEQSANTRPLRTMKNLDYSTQDIAQQESPAFEEEHIFQSMPMIRQEEAIAVTSISPSSSSSSLLSTKWTYKGFRWIKKTKGAVQKKECLVKHRKLIDYDQGSYFPRMTSSESSLELSTVANFECHNDKTKSGNQSTPLKKIKAEMCCINCKKQKNNHHDLVFINLECFHSMCKDCANWKFSVHNKERPLRCDKCFQEIRKIKNRVIK